MHRIILYNWNYSCRVLVSGISVWSKISIATLVLMFPSIWGSQCLHWRPRSEKCTQTAARNQTAHLDVIQQSQTQQQKKGWTIQLPIDNEPINFQTTSTGLLLTEYYVFSRSCGSCWKGGLREKYHSPLRLTGIGLLYYIFFCYIQQENESVHFPIPLCNIQEDWLTVLVVVSVLDCCCWTLWSYLGSLEHEQTFRTWMLWSDWGCKGFVLSMKEVWSIA